MKATELTIPEVILIAGTRVALGVGVGLLLADKLSHDQRQAAGWPLLLVGALTTIPLAMEVRGKGDGCSDARAERHHPEPAA